MKESDTQWSHRISCYRVCSWMKEKKILYKHPYMINMSIQLDECMKNYYRGLTGFMCPWTHEHKHGSTKERRKRCSISTSHPSEQQSTGGTGRVPAGAAPLCPQDAFSALAQLSRLRGAWVAAAVAPRQPVAGSERTSAGGLRHSTRVRLPEPSTTGQGPARNSPPISCQSCQALFLFTLNADKCLTQNTARLLEM